MGFFTKKPASKSVAKDRLKLVLIHDRANCSTELLEQMRLDIINVIRKYMDVNNDELDLKIGSVKSETMDGNVPALIANIPINKLRTPRS